MKDENPEEEARREADETLATRAWALVWNRKAPLWAALGIAVVFTVRVAWCSVDVPEGLDFKWYGEHCGPGHGDPDREPVDELDAACRRHDAAYREGADGTGGFSRTGAPR